MGRLEDQLVVLDRVAVLDGAVEHLQGERVRYVGLDEPLQRPCSVRRVVTVGEAPLRVQEAVGLGEQPAGEVYRLDVLVVTLSGDIGGRGSLPTTSG